MGTLIAVWAPPVVERQKSWPLLELFVLVTYHGCHPETGRQHPNARILSCPSPSSRHPSNAGDSVSEHCCVKTTIVAALDDGTEQLWADDLGHTAPPKSQVSASEWWK